MGAISVSSDRRDYITLIRQVREAGLLRRRPWYYSLKIAGTIAAFTAGWAALFVVGNSPIALAVAAFLALAFTQVVFVGHDAGHQQIFGSNRANGLVGFVTGNLLTGLSFGWWVPKHNAHHAYPNQMDRDPDIASGVIVFTHKIAASRHGLARLLARWQAWLFFPLLLLEGVSLYVAGVQKLLRRRDRSACIEALLLGVHTAGYLTAVFWVLSPLRAFAFIAIQQALFGLYLGCSFAPNHKGMPILDRDDTIGFVRRQVLTARNVGGGRFTTFMLGGLNYQIEHHLFPTMPRANLARAQGVVRAFCAQHDLAYRQDSVFDSFGQALRHLNQVGIVKAPKLLASGQTY